MLAIDVWMIVAEFPDLTMRMLIHDPETVICLDQPEASISPVDQSESGLAMAWIEDITP